MPRLDPNDPILASPDYPHGEARGYNGGCSCLECRRWNAAATARRKARRTGKIGTPVGCRIEASHVVAHLQKILNENPSVRYEHIDRAAGLKNDVTSRLLKQPRPLVSEPMAEALLAVTAASAVRASLRKMVPAAPVKEHLEMLMASECGNLPTIASASGLDNHSLVYILKGQRERVRVENARAILSVTPERLWRASALVPARKAQVRIRALQANGWTMVALNERLGYHRTNMTAWLTKEGAVIHQNTDRLVQTLYEEIEDRPGGSARVAAQARTMGFYPPTHYDDDMNLIPESIPGKRHRRQADPTASASTRSRNRLRMLGLTLREHTAEEIATMLRCSDKSVERARGEVGLRLECNDHLLADLPYVKRGQDELVALIAERTSQIEILDDSDALDAPDLNYVALWTSLVEDAKQYAVRAEYVALWESLLDDDAADLAVA